MIILVSEKKFVDISLIRTKIHYYINFLNQNSLMYQFKKRKFVDVSLLEAKIHYYVLIAFDGDI